MKFILGTKVNMTQMFDDQGRVVPGTIIAAGPLKVVQVKTAATDKYEAVRVGFGTRQAKNVSKSVRPLATKAGLADNTAFSHLKEFSLTNPSQSTGDTIDVSVFAPGDTVAISGLTKAKGFQGVVKRHGFGGGRRSHGQKHSEREPGSIGATAPQRVFKGVRMGGRMGGTRVTVKNLKIVRVDTDNNLLFVGGAVPGRRGTLLEIRSVK